MKKVELAFLFCGVCGNALYLICNGLFTPWYILLTVALWLSSSAIQVAMHEIGHLIGGLISKYNLVCFSVGAVQLSYRNKSKFTISFAKNHGSQCIMEPRNPEKPSYLCYNLGGIFANLVFVLMSAVLLLLDLHITNLLFINLVCSGVQKIIVNSVPSFVNGAPSDAYVVKLLSCNKAVQKDYCKYLKLYASYYREDTIDCRDYEYFRPLDVPEKELLYYREIQSILAEIC